MYERIATMPAELWEAIDLDQIPMRWFPTGWGAAESVSTTTDLFLADAQRFVPNQVGVLSLIAIQPHGHVYPHEDGLTPGWSRFHFVLRSNRWCWSFHDGAWQQLEVGGIYRMDPNKIHAALNWGADTRWHLIADSHCVQ